MKKLHWAPDNNRAACGVKVGHLEAENRWINSPHKEGPIAVTCEECARKRREKGMPNA